MNAWNSLSLPDTQEYACPWCSRAFAINPDTHCSGLNCVPSKKSTSES